MPEQTSKAAKGEHTLTRQAVLDRSFLKMIRIAVASIGRSDEIRTDEQIDALVEAAIATRPDHAETWIFAYGSLMWNPTFNYSERCNTTLHGWHRRFCLRSPVSRGTPENPCLMLGLEQGKQTSGVAFRLPAGEERAELSLAFQREMFSYAYTDRWVTVETPDGPRNAITFVANPEFLGYAGQLTNEEIAVTIATAKGSAGTCADYFFQTLEHLREFKMEDSELETIGRMLSGYLAAAEAADH
jgi:glutathione-specific gamma-glutamylcyclotransferase